MWQSVLLKKKALGMRIATVASLLRNDISRRCPNYQLSTVNCGVLGYTSKKLLTIDITPSFTWLRARNSPFPRAIPLPATPRSSFCWRKTDFTAITALRASGSPSPSSPTHAPSFKDLPYWAPRMALWV